ncbi:type II toxin-antitoxin system HicA family toxin [Crocosphaera sp.]|uniref:type II toxin-antitoxin system HicA family toxin n=1 Tax=Crocosphaera sp. TaxID=2729996 RepID=UPI00342E7A05
MLQDTNYLSHWCNLPLRGKLKTESGYRKNYLPKKIRELKAMLLKADCICEQGNGSHTKWSHPLLNYKITISGKDGNDAKRYQEKDVKDFLKDIKEVQK